MLWIGEFFLGERKKLKAVDENVSKKGYEGIKCCKKSNVWFTKFDSVVVDFWFLLFDSWDQQLTFAFNATDIWAPIVEN